MSSPLMVEAVTNLLGEVIASQESPPSVLATALRWRGFWPVEFHLGQVVGSSMQPEDRRFLQSHLGPSAGVELHPKWRAVTIRLRGTSATSLAAGEAYITAAHEILRSKEYGGFTSPTARRDDWDSFSSAPAIDEVPVRTEDGSMLDLGVALFVKALSRLQIRTETSCDGRDGGCALHVDMANLWDSEWAEAVLEHLRVLPRPGWTLSAYRLEVRPSEGGVLGVQSMFVDVSTTSLAILRDRALQRRVAEAHVKAVDSFGDDRPAVREFSRRAREVLVGN